MIPQVGDPVLVLVNPADNNGSDVAPGVLTRVAGMAGSTDQPSYHLVNAKAFLDEAGFDEWVTSARLYASESDARQGRDAAGQPHDKVRVLFPKSATVR